MAAPPAELVAACVSAAAAVPARMLWGVVGGALGLLGWLVLLVLWNFGPACCLFGDLCREAQMHGE